MSIQKHTYNAQGDAIYGETANINYFLTTPLAPDTAEGVINQQSEVKAYTAILELEGELFKVIKRGPIIPDLVFRFFKIKYRGLVTLLWVATPSLMLKAQVSIPARELLLFISFPKARRMLG